MSLFVNGYNRSILTTGELSEQYWKYYNEYLLKLNERLKITALGQFSLTQDYLKNSVHIEPDMRKYRSWYGIHNLANPTKV